MHYFGDRNSREGNKQGSLGNQKNCTNFPTVPANYLDSVCLFEEVGEERDGFHHGGGVDRAVALSLFSICHWRHEEQCRGWPIPG